MQFEEWEIVRNVNSEKDAYNTLILGRRMENRAIGNEIQTLDNDVMQT